MRQREASHQDILEWLSYRSGDGDLRFVVLKDRVVECNLKLRFLDEGSLDPLAAAILSYLRDRKVEVTLDDLSGKLFNLQKIGPLWVVSRRVIAQVLFVLEQAKEIVVRQESDGTSWFAISRAVRMEKKRVRVQSFEDHLRYIPPSRQLARDMPAVPGMELGERLRVGRLPQLELPQNAALYTRDQLEVDINSTCESYYTGSSIIPGLSEAEGRNDILQRSGLSDRPSFLGASILEILFPDGWIAHRCYLYLPRSSGLEELKIFVRRFPGGPQQNGYTQYLRTLGLNSPEVLTNLWKAAQKIA